MNHQQILSKIGLDPQSLTTGNIVVKSPIHGDVIGRIAETPPGEIGQMIEQAQTAFLHWREVPAPKRGELVRLFGEELRAHKEALAQLVTLECGKILEEARGEVQEMIDMCDFAVGLSRQLYGLTIASERPNHRMMETWHPLGVVGMITPFNFPVAVWSWNACLALICGDALLWKPSEKTPLTALACQKLLKRAMASHGAAPEHLQQLVMGGASQGEMLVDSRQIPLISATGSCRMGERIAPRIAARFGRSLLELGGNNAAIVTPTADLSLTVQSMVFSAAGTAGQRCTSLRRAFVHESIYDQLIPALKKRYDALSIGDPLNPAHIIGPLIDEGSYQAMQKALQEAQQEGGKIHGGGRILQDIFPNAYYVRPAIVEMPSQTTVVRTETFAPILYVMKYQNFEDAIQWQNDVPQGLSSCIFTNDIREAEHFISGKGSDCGIANVNIGPSGAEIGGAFGGDKATGGGREAGSDAWKSYMRRSTNTINSSSVLTLAQGIQFDR